MKSNGIQSNFSGQGDQSDPEAPATPDRQKPPYAPQITFKKKLLLPGPGKTHPIQLAEPDTSGEGYRVTLFNDDVHSMDQVVAQLMKALKCPMGDAVELMLQAHTNGKAIVAITGRSEAERIAAVLREISLRVRVDKI